MSTRRNWQGDWSCVSKSGMQFWWPWPDRRQWVQFALHAFSSQIIMIIREFSQTDRNTYVGIVSEWVRFWYADDWIPYAILTAPSTRALLHIHFATEEEFLGGRKLCRPAHPSQQRNPKGIRRRWRRRRRISYHQRIMHSVLTVNFLRRWFWY